MKRCFFIYFISFLFNFSYAQDILDYEAYNAKVKHWNEILDANKSKTKKVAPLIFNDSEFSDEEGYLQYKIVSNILNDSLSLNLIKIWIEGYFLQDGKTLLPIASSTTDSISEVHGLVPLIIDKSYVGWTHKLRQDIYKVTCATPSFIVQLKSNRIRIIATLKEYFITYVTKGVESVPKDLYPDVNKRFNPYESIFLQQQFMDTHSATLRTIKQLINYVNQRHALYLKSKQEEFERKTDEW